MLAWKFDFTCQCRISWSNLRIIPKKSQYRDVRVGSRRPITFAQHPRRVGILESIDYVTENIIILRKKVGPFVVTAAGGGSVGKSLIEICVLVMPIGSKAARRIVSAGGAAKFSQQRHGQISDAHVVHRLMVAAFGGDELADIQHIIKRTASTFPQRLRPGLSRGMTFNRR